MSAPRDWIEFIYPTRSETLRASLDHLDRSDLIVYLAEGSCPNPQSIACLSMIGRNAAKRFVRITFVMQAHGSRTILATFTDHLLAQMAHELQHAIEVADDPVVVDGATLGAAYQRWGFRPDPKSTTTKPTAPYKPGSWCCKSSATSDSRSEGGAVTSSSHAATVVKMPPSTRRRTPPAFIFAASQSSFALSRPSSISMLGCCGVEVGFRRSHVRYSERIRPLRIRTYIDYALYV